MLIAEPLESYGIQIRDVVSETEIARGSHGGKVGKLAFAPDNRSLVIVDEGNRQIRVWLFNSTSAFADLRDKAPIARMQFSEDGSHLYTASNHSKGVWQLPPLGGSSLPIRQESPEKVVMESERYRIRFPTETSSDKAGVPLTIYDMKSGQDRQTMTFDTRILAASVNRNGEQLAVILPTKSTRGGYERSLEIWNSVTKKQIASRPFGPVLDESRAGDLSFLGSDQYLAIGTREGIEIVKAGDLSSVSTLYHSNVTETAINSNGTLAATMGADGEMRVWEIVTPNEVARIENSKPVVSMALSNDHRWLATLAHGGTVQLWAIQPPDLIQQACRWVTEPCP